MPITKTALLFFIPLSGCLCAGDPGNLVPKTVTEDSTLPAIEINGTRLYAEAHGDPNAPLILTMHGGPGSDYRGLLTLKALADDGYRVAFWDQRGTGLSQRHDADTIDLDVYLEDLRLVIDHYAPTQQVVIIGQSWGAMYATAFFNTYGDYNGKIRGAILTEPGAFNTRQLEDFMKKLQGSLSLVDERLNDAFAAPQFMSPADHERADYQASIMAMHGAPSEANDPNHPLPFWRAGAVVKQRLLEIAKEGFDWTTNLDAFQHPVLFLRGDLNTVVTLEHQQELAAAYPNAEIETITGVGHHSSWDRPEEYLTHTRAYLREIGVGQ
jgi:proline iminopeptidase